MPWALDECLIPVEPRKTEKKNSESSPYQLLIVQFQDSYTGLLIIIPHTTVGSM